MNKIDIIDGGVGTELQRRGVEMNPSSWSATAHQYRPELLLQIHLDYLNAGATVISSNTFMAGRHILEAGGNFEFKKINTEAVKIARQARRDYSGRNILIAGCMSTLPPLNQADKLPSGTRISANFRDQAKILVDSGADVLLAEMLIDSESASRLLDECCKLSAPVWAGLSAMRCSGSQKLMTFRQANKLSGNAHESFKKLLKTICGYPIEKIGVMHTDVELIVPALEQITDLWRGTCLAYAKIGTADEQQWQFSQKTFPKQYSEIVKQWMAQFPISVVGGCCGTTPAHIQSISNSILSVQN